MEVGTNFRTNAALLIVTAAEKSGLLQEIAQVLHFHDNKTFVGIDCLACEMRERLIEAFDDHICLPGMVVESFYGEGFNPEVSEEEIAPYLGTASTAESRT